MNKPTDEQLMLDHVSGDKDAFATLVTRYRGAVLGHMVSKLRGDADHAEDIVQTTFLKVWQNAARFDPSREFKKWLFGIANHTYLDALRSRGRRRKHVTDDSADMIGSAVDEKTPAPDEAVSIREQLRTLPELMLGLPYEQRKAIEVVVMEGVSSRKAESTLGVGYKSIQKRVKQGLAQLRNKKSPTMIVGL